MRDRWANRPEPPEGQGTVYWHALLSGYPQARAAAAIAQTSLATFDGFHLTPSDWLHMTVLVGGSTEQVAREQLQSLLDAARVALADTPAPAVTLERILYHPEAIMLAIEPVADLHSIRRQIDNATSSVVGTRVDDEATAKWVPHMTVGYSTAEQSARPIIDTLGFSIPPHRVAVEAITLVVQWGPERRWNWEQIGTVKLIGEMTASTMECRG
jgi:2'-5' RNA ligase